MSSYERVTYGHPFGVERTIYLADVTATAEYLYGIEVDPDGAPLWFGRYSTTRRRHVIERVRVLSRTPLRRPPCITCDRTDCAHLIRILHTNA